MRALTRRLQGPTGAMYDAQRLAVIRAAVEALGEHPAPILLERIAAHAIAWGAAIEDREETKGS